MIIRQSTEITVLIGPFVDKTDGVTAETGLAGTGTEIDKNGAGFAAGPALGTHDESGWYPITLTTTHTNTCGRLLVKCYDAATHLPVWREFNVVEEQVWDSLMSTDKLQVDVQEWLGAAVTADSDHPEVHVVGIDQDIVNDNAVNQDVYDSINAEVDGAIETYHLDHLLAATYDPASKPGVADALLNELVENDGGVSRFTENALEQAPSGTGASAADIADAVLEEAVADHVGVAGSLAKILDNIEDDTEEIGAAGAGLTAIPWNAAWDAEVQSEVTDGLNAYDPPTKAELDSGLAGLNDPTAASIADAVLDEALSGHTGAGSLGKAVADIESDATDILADTNEVQGKLPTNYIMGSSVQTDKDDEIDAIKAKTDNLPADPADDSDIDSQLSTIDTEVGQILAKMPTNYVMGSDDQDDHNAELEDWANGGRLDLLLDQILADTGAVADTNLTEPTAGAPSASVTLKEAIAYLYFAFRNKRTVTSSEEQFFNDAGSAIYERALSDDGTTFTAEELAAVT